MEKTNSYKKYYDIITFVENQSEREVDVISISEFIGLGRKQTIRCVAEIAEVNGKYELTKIGRTTALRKVK